MSVRERFALISARDSIPGVGAVKDGTVCVAGGPPNCETAIVADMAALAINGPNSVATTPIASLSLLIAAAIGISCIRYLTASSSKAPDLTSSTRGGTSARYRSETGLDVSRASCSKTSDTERSPSEYDHIPYET